MTNSSASYPRTAAILKLCALLSVPVILWAYAAGPDAHKTAIPGSGEGSCSDVGCHIRTIVNSGGSVTLSSNNGFYTPGVRQTLSIFISDSGARAFGFQLTARPTSNRVAQAGTFTAVGNQLVLCAGASVSDLGDIRPASGVCPAGKPLEFVEHGRALASGVITVDWTPPVFSAGPVEFYVSAVAANGNGNEAGDNTYTGSLTLFPGPVQDFAPVISGTTPAVLLASSSSQTVTLLGSGFQAGLSVRLALTDGRTVVFGPTALQNVTSSSVQVSTVFNAPGTYLFQIVNPSGLQSNIQTLVVNSSPQPPVITSVFPSTPITSSSPQTLSVTGSLFTIGSSVSLAGPRNSLVIFSGPLILNLGSNGFAIAATLTDPGTYTMTVTNPDGQRSQPFSFTAKSAVPLISSISPSSLLASSSSQSVRITGAAFQPGLTLKLGFPNVNPVVVPASQLAVMSDSVVTFSAVFASKGAYSIQAVNADGGTSNVYAFSVGVPLPVISGVVNGASFQPTISDGSWVTIEGTDLAPDTPGAGRLWNEKTEIISGILPRSLDGVSVMIGGKPAAVYFVSSRQLNVQAPITSKTGPLEVTVTTSNGSSSPFIVNVQTVSPAMFLFTPKYPAAVFADGTSLGPIGLISGAVTRPAKPGDTILLFGTGLGPTDPDVASGVVFSGAATTRLPVTVQIGGVDAQVAFSGLTGAGLYQINLVVPDVPDGDRALTVIANGVRTPPGTFIAVQH